MRDGGKGDKPRPLSVPLEKFDEQWDLIFKNAKKLEERMKEEIERKLFDDSRD